MSAPAAPSRFGRYSGRSLLVLSLVGLAACAGKGDVDRTQPDKVDKTIFRNLDGSARTFYYRKTTVGVPPTTSFAFEGIMSDLLKVNFEITEDYLIGYRAYDYVIGSENPFTGAQNNHDSPLLVFKIESHFDVKREYNPGTGEETNVISENDKDRPWDQRQFMRVDWSKNLADPPEAGADPSDPMAYLASQKLDVGFTVGEGDDSFTNPDRPIITADYIDFATKELRTPDYAACLKLFDSYSDDIGPWGCGQAEITYRNALMPVPKDSTFEPLEYPDREILRDDQGNPLRALGLYPCTSGILSSFGGAASGADCSVASVEQFSKFGFFRVERSQYDRRVGATEEGRQYYAFRWNIWQDTVERDGDGNPVMVSGKPKVLPYHKRQTRTIPYYLNVEWPQDDLLTSAATTVIADWNQAMKETVAALQMTEQGNSMSMTDVKKAAAALPDIFVLKHNGCEIQNVQNFIAANDDVRALVEKQVSTDALDLSNITAANLTQACSALSKVTEDRPAGDPKKPKFEWQRDGDLRYSFLYWVDRPQPGGPLGYGPSSADPETGEIISASAYIYGASMDTYAQFAVDSVQLANGQLDPDDFLSGKTISDVLAETAKASKARLAQPITDGARNLAQARLRAQGKTPSDRLVKVGAGIDDQAIAQIKGTPLEKVLFNDDVLPGLIRGYTPGDVAPTDVFGQAMQNPWFSSQAREQERARFQTLAAGHGCLYMAEFADDAILGTALDLDKMKLSGDQMFKELRARILRGIADHEVGHTMGLRHNFAASSDALNYDDQFWKIHETMPADQWADASLSEYQYASVMDYGSRFNSDLRGLGKYDTAAIRFGYGQLIDILPSGSASYDTMLQNVVFLYDYTALPKAVGGIDKLTADAAAVVPYQQYKDTIRADYLAVAADPNTDQVFTLRQRPYKFCEDFFEGNLDCKTWDFGANQNEIIDNVQSMYRNYYIFNAYKRGRTTWQVDDYLNRLESRYFNRYSEAFEFYYFLGDQFTDPNQWNDPYNLGLGMPTIGDDLLRASMSALNALGEVLQTPEPGLHCAVPEQPDVMIPIDVTQTSSCMANSKPTSITLPDAKPFFISLSDDFYYRITQVGSLYDKMEALLTLTSTESRFFRVTDADINGRSSINFYRTFRDEMLKLLSGVIQNDPSLYGGTLVNGVYQATPVVDPAVFGTAGAAMPSYAQPGTQHVDTPVNKTIRDWALMLALARLGSTWDQTLDFQNFLVVTVKGSNDDQVWGSNIGVKEYAHPVTGVVFRAPVYPTSSPANIGSGLLDELDLLTGRQPPANWKPGDPNRPADKLDAKWGTYNGETLPTWYYAKATLDAAMAGTDQQALNDAQTIFSYVDQLIGYRVDLISDIRTFRKELLFP